MIDELKSLSSGFQLAMRDNPSQNIDYGTYRNQAFANAGQRLIYGQDSQRSSSSMSYTYGQPSPYANTSSPYPLSGYLPQRSYSYESSSQTNNLPPTEYGIVDVVIGAGAGYKMTTAELDSGSKGSGMNSISAKFLRQLKSEYNYSPYSVPNLDRIRTAKEDFSPSSCVNLDISLVLPDENGNQKRQAQTTENFYVIDNDNFPNILLGREYMKQQSEKRGKSLLWLEKTGEKKKNEGE